MVVVDGRVISWWSADEKRLLTKTAATTVHPTWLPYSSQANNGSPNLPNYAIHHFTTTWTPHIRMAQLAERPHKLT